MRNYIKNYEKIKKKYRSIFLIGFWAKYGVQEYKWTGKFVDTSEGYLPEVYYYNDHNGTYETYTKVPLNHVTTGVCIGYSFNKENANYIANKLNNEVN